MIKIKSSAIVQKLYLSIFFLALFAVAAGAHAISFSAMDAACASAVPVDLIGIHRGYGSEPVDLLNLEVPSPGILAMDIVVPGSARRLPRLGLLHGSCGDYRGHQDIETIEHTATHLVLAVRNPGTYFFRLGAQDPRYTLGEYKLTTRFAAAAAVEDEPSEIGPFYEKSGENEEEDQPDPGPGRATSTSDSVPSRLLLSIARLGGVNMHKSGENEEEDQPDPGPGTPAQRFRLDDLCRVGERDDHGDTFTCATSIAPGRSVTGEIRNGWGDDDDVFAFTLSELRTVAIEATGDAGTFGELYDRFGQRLAISDEVGSMVKTLGPGPYFIRVGAAGTAVGPYQLNVQVLDW